MRIEIICLPILALLLNACSHAPPQLSSTDSRLLHCLNLYQEADTMISAAGTEVSHPARITGFPYLRTDRFLAGYRQQDMDQKELAIWLQRMARIERSARTIELSALADKDYQRLTKMFRGEPEEILLSCSDTLVQYDLKQPERIAVLRRNAAVPSEYLTYKQMLGLYPLTAIPISIGVKNYHRETRETFEQALSKLPVTGRLQRFVPPETVYLPSTVPIARDVLGIPVPAPAMLETLFARHAPVWEIDVAGSFDLPGSPFLDDAGIPSVDTRQPVVYRYPSYIRWQNKALLQLNYMIWFAERPSVSGFDILAGALDGLVWRVTLQPDGSVLIYDTIHPCGCYHYFFPGPALQLRPQALTLPEPPLVPQSAPVLSAQQHMVIRIASATHYIQRIYPEASVEGTPYEWRSYDELYRIPAAGSSARHSLFATDGLVAGSERAERWLLWPMGIPSAGAMRERGRHATAFVGRRHFDDANLLNQLFEPISFE